MAKNEYPVLRFIVIAMGVLLVVGTIILFGIIIKRVTSGEPVIRPSKSPKTVISSERDSAKPNIVEPSQSIASSTKTYAECKGKSILSLKGQGEFVSLDIDGAIARMVLRDGGKYNIITFDNCTGNIYGDLQIITDSN